MIREGVVCSCLGEEHSRLREQSVQRLSGGSLSAVFKENPEGLRQSEERGEEEGVGSEAVGTDRGGPRRNSGVYSQRNGNHFFLQLYRGVIYIL